MSENNPYESPESELVEKADGIGGSLESAIAGDFHFDVMGIIKTAWEELSGFKGTAWLAFLIIIIISVVIEGVRALLGPSVGAVAFTQILSWVITAPVSAGLVMLGIYRAGNRDVNASQIFGYYNKILKIIGLNLLMGILVLIGFILLIIPGIYLAVSYTFAIPLMLEKDLGIWEAMEASRKAVSKKWFSFFGVLFMLGLIVFISAIPFGIGLIWTLPLSVLLIGVLYREVFGILPE